MDRNCGYITVVTAQSQVKPSVALMLSLKREDPSIEFHLITRPNIEFGIYLELFDGYTIEPNVTVMSVFMMTPFDRTIYIDPVSIASSSVRDIWNCCDILPIYIGEAFDFRGDKINCNQNDLLSSSIFYFEQSIEFTDIANALNDLTDISALNIGILNKSEIPSCRTLELEKHTADLKLTAALRLLNIPPLARIPFTDINRKSNPVLTKDWNDLIALWFNNGNELFVNNHRQIGIVSYHDPAYITTEVIDELSR
jgi:hypothetical protein